MAENSRHFRTVAEAVQSNQPDVWSVLCTRYPQVRQQGKVIHLAAPVTARNQRRPVEGRLAAAL